MRWVYESRSKDFRDIIRLIRTLFINFLKTEGRNIFKYFSLLLSFFNGRYLLLIFEASNTAWNMREYGFHWPVFFRIRTDSVLIWENMGQWKLVFSHILCCASFPRTKKEVLKWDEISIHFQKLIIALLILTKFKKISEKSHFQLVLYIFYILKNRSAVLKNLVVATIWTWQ